MPDVIWSVGKKEHQGPPQEDWVQCYRFKER